QHRGGRNGRNDLPYHLVMSHWRFPLPFSWLSIESTTFTSWSLLGGRDLLPCFLGHGMRVEHQLVRDVVLVDVAHVGRGLDADLLRRDDFDVVEPLVGVEAALGRLPAHLRNVARSAVVACECEQGTV